MQLYMLDTNTASYIIKGEPVVVREHLLKVPMETVCISSITQAELLRGVARKPEAKRLPIAVKEFLIRVEIMPCDSDATEAYARLRTSCETPYRQFWRQFVSDWHNISTKFMHSILRAGLYNFINL